ncbi:xanthine dehydrogenase family protein subunit M [Aurantimonas sp. VKM B-3413]|uniref:FAD binding domain-containing protein n=1 Tax=Aurantimonas sp. VKM B-3413 TaxID=2779401 RepID=UPI001E51043A|nr:xanthine dehydrogenase family protein subunit M [Aurantimonas sp. VKM B-3413]MCB8839676.1 xanthine dehydrogenase family protein subunit M [Aurantimonas sp. VKM B-3413]
MRPFVYERARNAEDAVAAIRRHSRRDVPSVQADGQYIAGGTNMSDYMRLDVMRPDFVLDVNEIAGDNMRRIRVGDSGLRIGSLVRMAEAEDNETIQRDYPVIHDTMKLAATRQIRNMASLGGNVLQRTRCDYFREVSFPCNKRDPGSGCAAINGFNRQHAVLGVSDSCIARYPGDFGQALVALDATVDILGPNGPRTMRFADLHKLPGDTPWDETELKPGELILGYNIPAGPHTKRSRYVKVRDRDSYQYALTAAAVALDMDGDTVRDVRIALGGVAAAPWRAHDAEEILKGRTLDEDSAAEAADAAFQSAVTHQHNAYKVPIGKQTIIRALFETRDMEASR